MDPFDHAVQNTMLLLIVLLISTCTGLSQTSNCNDSYSCAFSETIQDNTKCRGYYSCAFSEKMIVDTLIDCDGALSCYNLSSIIINATAIDYPVDLNCDGLFSCANNDNIQVSATNISYSPIAKRNINCNGELSCFDSKIFILANHENLFINCFGDRSCAQTFFWIAESGFGSYFKFNGYLAAQNSVVFVNTSVTFDFLGRSSGQNTTIICHSRSPQEYVYHQIFIDCHSNACDGLKLYQNEGCRFLTSCYSATKSNVCPDGYNLYSDTYTMYFEQYSINGTIPTWPELYTNINSGFGTDFNNSGKLCAIPLNMSSIMWTNQNETNKSNISNWKINTGLNNSYPINCGNCKECINGILNSKQFIDPNIHDIDVPVCCTASSSCINAQNISISSHNDPLNGWYHDHNSLQQHAIIRCDGKESCQNATLTVSIPNNMTANVYLSGKNSFVGGKIYNGAYGINSNINVLLTGSSHYGYCNYKNIFGNGWKNISNIYITGTLMHMFCSDINQILMIANVTQNTYFYGYGTGMMNNTNKMIKNIGSSVYCGVDYSCSYAQIDNIHGSVNGMGANVMSYSTISNVNRDIYVIGSYALQNSTITNVSNSVFMIGSSVGTGTTIVNATNVCDAIYCVYLENNKNCSY